MAAVCAALVFTGATAESRAQSAHPQALAQTTFADPTATLSPSTPHKMQWNSKGRWGLKFDYQQSAASGADFSRDIDVGTFYKVTPRLHIGGTVGVTEQTQPRLLPDPTTQPRVRLETTFKF